MVPPAKSNPAEIRQFILDFLAKLRGVRAEDVEQDRPFSDFGLNSVDAVQLARGLSDRLGRAVPPTVAWDYPTAASLIAFLSSGFLGVSAGVNRNLSMGFAVAVVGMGCRYPGAKSLAELFDLLCSGTNPVREVPADRWSVTSFFDRDPAAPAKMSSRWGGFLEDLDRFDAGFFRMSPREAAQLDPRQRLTLETAWEALEDAGQDTLALAGSDTGVFVATLASNYGSLIFDRHLEIVDASSGTGNGNSVTANRISYAFDFRGPSVALDTACSGSLVAVHLACSSLQSGECAIALAGGVNVILKPDETVFFTKTGALSPEGACRVFDRKANGIVRSEGVGMVVLKRLSDAVAAGDRIYAVIRATAVNQDGATNGIMAPNGNSQERLLREAYRRADIDPRDVQFVEAHGTGTALGDPIEVNALVKLLGAGRAKDQRCALGSIKSNIGHAEAAAGVAGLIKVALSIHHRMIPGNLHFEEPNPLIDFGQGAFFVQRQCSPWPSPEQRLIAGVSAFGFAGTNAHVVLEEYKAEATHDATIRGPYLLVISARHRDSLRALSSAYSRALRDGAEPASLCRAAATRRGHLEQRATFLADSSDALLAQLDAFANAPGPVAEPVRPSGLAFLFSGQGSHWAGMGFELFTRYAAFRECIEECEAHCKALTGESLLVELARKPGGSRIGKTVFAQPAICAVQCALADLWKTFGLRPAAVLGQSLGEIAAAYCAGALSLADAMRVAVVRSRLMARLEGNGLTAAVALAADDFNAGKETGVTVAGYLSPRMILISGNTRAMHSYLEKAGRAGIFAKLLPGVELALHGPEIETLAAEMEAELSVIAPREAAIPLVSSITCSELTGVRADAKYWARNLCEAFRLPAALERLLAHDVGHCIEVSPHPMLATPFAAIAESLDDRALHYGSLQRDTSDVWAMWRTLGQIYTAGHNVDWIAVFGGRGSHVDIPHYPWRRERYWFDQLLPEGKVDSNESHAPGVASHPLLGRKVNLAPGVRESIWEALISADRTPQVAGHKVQGIAVFPAGGYLEMALEAVHRAGFDKTVRLADVSFAAAMVIDGERTVQTFVETEGAGGSFRILSAPAGAQDWTLHASGSFHSESPSGSAVPVAAMDEPLTGAEAIEAEVHYKAMSAMGLDYAGRYRSLVSIWRRGGRVTAQVQLAAPGDCRPEAFDACLQAVGAMGQATMAEDFRLPTGIGELSIFAPLPESFWCEARLAAGSSFDHPRLVADLVLFDAKGLQLGMIRGAVFAQPAPDKATRDDIRQWLYRVEWVPGTDRSERAPLPPAEEAAKLFTAGSEALAAQLELQHYALQWEEFDRLSLAYVLIALGKLGIQLRSGEKIDVEEAAARAGVASRHLRFWKRLFGILREEGIVDASGSVLRLPPQAAPELHASRIRERFPKADAELGLVQRGGRKLAEILRGDADSLEVLFAGQGDDLLERLYRDSTFSRYYSAAIATAVAMAAKRISGERPLRVLEIGAGTGATTQHVLPVLMQRDFTYAFTELSIALLAAARKKFASHAQMQFRQLDIERDPDQQGFARDGFDVVIAANVLHATADLRETLRHARKLTVEGGLLLLLEGSGPQRWLDLIVGGTDGWWRFKDDLRKDYALATPAVWKSALVSAGFEAPVCIQDSTERPPQIVMISQAARDQMATHRYRWLIVGQPCEVAERLSMELTGLGAQVTRAQDVSEVKVQLAAPKVDQQWKVISTQALTVESWQRLNTRRSLRLHEELVYPAIELARTVAEAGAPARLWFLTRNAQQISGARALEIAQAPVWGVGRVAASEHPEVWGGLIDLDGEPDAGEVDSILSEVLSSSGEDQVAYRSAGRLVARLVGCPDSAVAIPLSLRKQSAYLITGGLRGIGLAAAERLIERGARHLVLVSRTQLPRRNLWRGLAPESRHWTEVQAVLRLEALGASVITAAFDAADEQAFRAFLDDYEAQQHPPIRGVIHSAGLIHDQLLMQADLAVTEAVTHPKIGAAWLLHELFSAQSLEFFVLFSSGTSLLGTFGQANYAAGNAFMDALAHHRRALGLPAISINWGVWAEVGIVARGGQTQRLADNGLLEIAPNLGLSALEAIIAGNPAQVAAMPTDWERWRKIFPLGQEKPLFLGLLDEMQRRAPQRETGSYATNQRVSFSGGDSERRSQARELVKAVVAGVLQADAGELEAEVPLNRLGLDSIMAMEIRNKLETLSGSKISIIDLLSGASINVVAERLLSGMSHTERGDPGATREQDAAIPRAEHVGELKPCSPAQEAIWWIETTNHARSPVYSIPVAVELERRLDAGILRRALTATMGRHEALRTCFQETSEGLRQRVMDDCEPELLVEDLGALSPEREESEVRRLRSEFSCHFFDLGCGQLARFMLINRNSSALFMLNIHHLVFDGWSAGVLVQDLARTYERLSRKEPLDAPPSHLTYGEFATWMSGRARDGTLTAQIDFWRETLRGGWQIIELPADYVQPARRTYAGGKLRLDLESSTGAAVHEMARVTGSTPFMVLNAALSLLVHLESGQERFLLATTPSLRNRPELTESVGYFVNTILLPVEISKTQTFGEILMHARKTALGAFANAEVALQDVLRAVRADGVHVPPIQLVLTLQNSPLRLPELVRSYETLDNGTAKFDLVLNLIEDNGAFSGWWEYSTELFHPETVRRLSTRFCDVLARVMANPGLTPSDLSPRPEGPLPAGVAGEFHFPRKI